MTSPIAVATALAELESSLQSNDRVILNFWAEWCSPAKHMNSVFAELAKTNPNIKFIQIEAEKSPDISAKFSVEAVPFFVFVQNGTVKDTLVGANPPELLKKVTQFNEGALPSKQETQASTNTASTAEELNVRLARLTNYAPVMLFMKGTPDIPKCGFSRKIVEVLRAEKIKFSSFDILQDQSVREGLKTFSNWPTYPQLYIQGKLIGGLDIVKELQEEGELSKLIPKEEVKDDLNTRLTKLVNQAPVMLFMKGTPEAPRCGFSGRIVGVLKETGHPFSSFDILTDEEVREGLKKFSNWPTYPQLYVKGKLIGGLDIVKELHEEGELQGILDEAASQTQAQ
jgi:Grx4 family monothiol glutaredoxin